MKWYQAFVKGAGDQYLNIRDRERDHQARLAEIREQMNVDLAKDAAKDALKNNMKFGDFILKDRDRVGDMWTDRENRVKDFDAAMKGWFFNDNGTFNADTYTNFKTDNPNEFKNMLNEYDTRIGQWLYPKDRTMSGSEEANVISKDEYNLYDSSWLSELPEFQDIAETYNVARDVSQTSAIETDSNGQAIVKMFDVVKPQEGDTPIEGRRPEELINRPDRETIKNIANAMEPLLTHSQYGLVGSGGMFANKEDYYKKILGTSDNPGEFEHVAVIANIMWNAKNKVGGITNDNIRDEELAQAQLYYGLSFKEMMSSVNQMMPKFQVHDQGGKRTITRYKGLPTKDISAANQRLAANYRIGHLGERLLQSIDEYERTGAVFNIDQALWGIFGEGGQWEQLKSTFGEWTSGSVAQEYFTLSGVEGSMLEEQKQKCEGGFRCLWTDMKTMREWDKGDKWRKDKGATREYLKITLAYSLALSEQGSGGGKAISDKDYENAYNRIGDLWGTVGQNRWKLKDLLTTNKYDLTISHIQTEQEFASTSNEILKWYEGGYKERFKKVVERYTDKLAGNPVYGMITEPVFNDKGEIVGRKPLEGQIDVNGEMKNFRYDGRLSRLFQIDFGENPDFSAEEGTQGLWDSLGEHEKAVLRGTNSYLKKFDSIFENISVKEDGLENENSQKTGEGQGAVTPSNEVSMGQSEEILNLGENKQKEQTGFEAQLSQFQNAQFWLTDPDAEGIVTTMRNDLRDELYKKVTAKYSNVDFEQFGEERKYEKAFNWVSNYDINGWGVFEDPKVRELFNRYEDLNKALSKGQEILKDYKKKKES